MMKKFVESIAPGQGQNIIDKVLCQPSIDTVPQEILNMFKIHRESDSMVNMVNLSLIDHAKCTKEVIMNGLNFFIMLS